MTKVIRHSEQEAWDALVQRYQGHPLQLWGWGEVKAAHGWRVERLQVGEGGAQLLIKALPKPFGPLVYAPRGPFGNLLTSGRDREDLVGYVKSTYGPTLMSVEPDTPGPLDWSGWRRSANQILIPRTAVIDLTQPEAELLRVMSKKTRQYIRKSAGEGIEVVTATTPADIDDCLAIYKQTAQRAGFALHGDEYYHDIFGQLGDASPVYMAKHGGRTVAFLWPIVTPEVAFELYGGMDEAGQRLRANYHLKWSVILAMKARGVRRYDVNGLLNDGVSAFKQGFIPEEIYLSGSYDYPMSPLYVLWRHFLPVAKRIARVLR